MAHENFKQEHTLRVINQWLNKNMREKISGNGICGGLVGLYIEDSHKLRSTLKEIYQLSRFMDIDTPEANQLFCKFYDDIIDYQFPGQKWPDISQFALDAISQKRGADVSNVFSICSVCTKDKLNLLISKLINDSSQENYLRLSGPGHAMIACIKGGKYSLYDPNSESFEIACNSIEELSFLIYEKLFSASKENVIFEFNNKSEEYTQYLPTPGGSIPIIIDIFSKNKSVPKYPNRVDLFKEVCDMSAAWDGKTSLQLAVIRGHKDIVECILDDTYSMKQPIDSKDKKGLTALHHACEIGSVEYTEILLKHGAPINAVDKIYGSTPLHYAASLHDSPKICKILIVNHASVDHKNNDGETPFLLAASYGRLEICELLLDNGADINIKDKFAKSPLRHAIDYRHPEVVELLVKSNKLDNNEIESMLRRVNNSLHEDPKDAVLIRIKEILELPSYSLHFTPR